MKILLAQNSPYIPSLNGASKANRYLLEGLAARGNECRVVSLSSHSNVLKPFGQYLNDLGLGADVFTDAEGVTMVNGVEVHARSNGSRVRAGLIEQMRAFDPDWIFISSEDPLQMLLDAALKFASERVIYLAQTAMWLPFGPESLFPGAERQNKLAQVAGILTVSNYLKDYIKQYGGLEAGALPLPVYGAGPFPCYGRYGEGLVMMINPCEIKGISIFLKLAAALPEVRFGAVPTWGTTDKEREALAAHPNIEILKPEFDIDKIFARTNILLVPSLCKEAFGLVAVEAMLRGIPVLASNVGGLPEAKLNTEFLLPVREIERYEEQWNQFGDTEIFPVIPEQDIGPWQAALTSLLNNRGLYERHAAASREAALAYHSRLSFEPVERFLEATRAGQGSGGIGCRSAEATASTAALDRLSPERRALLSLRLSNGNRRKNLAVGL